MAAVSGSIAGPRMTKNMTVAPASIPIPTPMAVFQLTHAIASVMGNPAIRNQKMDSRKDSEHSKVGQVVSTTRHSTQATARYPAVMRNILRW